MSNTDHQSEIKKLGELIKGIRFAMLTTVDDDGTLRSRPMATQQIEFDGDLWFFTQASSPKVAEVDREHQVNLNYSDSSKQTYVSVSGIATLVRDRKKFEELWNPVYKTFFPKGLEDPELALLRVSVEKAEYWDQPHNPVVRAFAFAKAYATKNAEKLGDHEKLNLS